MATNADQALSVSEVARTLKLKSEPMLITGAAGFGRNFDLLQRAVDWRNDLKQDKRS
jgi:hypothetical protein